MLSLRNLGKLYMQTERYDEAVKLFERLVETLPRDYEGNWLVAQCLERVGRVDDALVRLQELAEIAPESDEVYREMGMIYLNQKGDMENARRMFARSLSLNPNQPELALLMTQQQQQMETPQMPEFGPPMPGVSPPVPELPFPQIPRMPPTPGR
jgi:Flp pilus assembly protein TadD